MAQVVRLARSDASPWGFRLQGGKDFGQPLLIQKVNGGSLAEQAGLQVGDALIRVNNVDVQDMRHKEAQDVLVRAGNSFELTVQRGGMGTWRPQVSPVGQMPSPGGRSPQTVTKTSLAAKPSNAPIPSGHNVSPRPFGGTPQMNGDAVKAIVNKQYNSPVGMYSEDSIAETLSAQAEVLAGGVLGVNFMKNEKTYDSQKSEVFKMVQEVEKEPRDSEPDFIPNTPTTTIPTVTGLRHVMPPEPKAPSSPQTALPPGQNICADCERLIVGVFVRIKDKNLHVECFKCATCGTSLKNVGYYTINHKLYCDIHAKMAARQNPPGPNLEPVTIPPGGRVPSGVFSTPSLPSPGPKSPQAGTLGPMPFHSGNTGPKPFGTQAPLSHQSSVQFSPPSAPTTPIISAPAPKPVSWPPAKKSVPQTASVDKKKIESQWPSVSPKPGDEIDKKRLSICSEEVCCISEKKSQKCSSLCEIEELRPASPGPGSQRGRCCTKKITANSQKLETSMQTLRAVSPGRAVSPNRAVSPRAVSPLSVRAHSPAVSASGEVLDISTKPHGIKSLLPPRAITPTQKVVFPPEIPDVLPKSRTCTPQPKREEHKEKMKKEEPSLPMKQPVIKEYKSVTEEFKKKIECSTKKIEKEIKKQDQPLQNKMFTKEEVEQIVKEELKKVFMSAEQLVEEKIEKKEVNLSDLPVGHGGEMASALCTAPDRPFTPVPFPTPLELPSVAERIPSPQPPKKPISQEPVPLPPETAPYFPPVPPPPEIENLDERTARAFREVGCRSPMTEALTVASERSFSPLPTIQKLDFKPIPKMSMASALTVAPKIPFTVPGKTPIPIVKVDDTDRKDIKPSNIATNTSVPYVPHVTNKFGIDHSVVAEGGRTKEVIKNLETKSANYSHQAHLKAEKTVERTTPTLTSSGLHCPGLLPYYQQNIGEIPVRNRSISPVPHQIRAPMLNPSPLTVNTCSQMTSHTSSSQMYKTTTFSESSTYAAKSSSKTETHKPEIREVLSPTWKISQIRSTQNLSPIQVRLPSPKPAPLAPVGVTSQVTSANVVVKPTPKSIQTTAPSCKSGCDKSDCCKITGGPCHKNSFSGNTLTNISSNKSAFSTIKIDTKSTEAKSLPKIPALPDFCGVDPRSSGPNSGGVGGGFGGGLGNIGGGGKGRSAIAGSTAPKRGRGVLNPSVPAGGRIPLCGHCKNQIRGPFITALGKIWCPDHFTCVNVKCKRPLQDIGFVEESDGLYCEYCFEQYLAPACDKCHVKIKGDCLNAIGKHFHPECFRCAYCDKMFGNNVFFLEDGLPYCENDWNELFTTKCIACGFPIEAGDRWVEALGNNYHSKCFNCTMCKKNLEGQSFFAKGGRPYCKTHAR